MAVIRKAGRWSRACGLRSANGLSAVELDGPGLLTVLAGFPLVLPAS
jgi:hypothetical protein